MAVIARRRWLSLAAVIVICGAVGVAVGSGSGAAAGSRPTHPGAPPVSLASLPAPPAGFAIPKPRQLTDATGDTRWAPVLRTTLAHRSPSFSSPGVAMVSKRTPEGTANLVVADEEITRDGVSWVRANLAVLPDGTAGWLPRSALGGWSFVDTRVVVSLARLTLTLYRAGRVVFRTPVGVGTPDDPTPTGTFYIRDRLTAFASPTYGPLAFGTSARAPHLTDWPDGGYIGIHGTDEPGLIPGRISHGCIRLTNTAILRLGTLLPVGTPVVIT